MNLTIKGIKIADPTSSHNQKVCDVKIQSGIITEIGYELTIAKDEKVFDGKNSILCPGFFDLNCSFGEPGYETKEDLQTGLQAAMAGGFTGLALMPNTNPIVQSKGEVAYLVNKTKDSLIAVHPIGAISKNFEGKELTEMFDMQQNGAIAFADTDRAITDDGFMSRALQYASGFGGLIFAFPENKSISGKAHVNESKTTILLGMKGMPALAEELQLSRDIFLAQYHQTKLHISNISTAGAVDIIRKAKQNGLKITCDVAAHQLVFTEEMLNSFDSNYKVKPPLRSQYDIDALINGLKDGTIDAIVSQHRPQEIEFKNVEFEIAKYGIITLQTVLPLVLNAGLSIELIIDKLAVRPRQILGLLPSKIAIGEKADLTAFNPHLDWTYNESSNFSKSTNSPLLDTNLQGKVTLVYNQNKYQIF